MRRVWLLLATCLWVVGSAFGQAGEGGGKVERLREKAEAVRGTPHELPVLTSLYVAERNAGNPMRAASVRERIFEHAEGGNARLNVHFLDAEYLAQNGDFRAARQQWDMGSAILARLDPQGGQRQHLARYRARQDWALAAILRVEGRSEEAGRALDRALAANDEDIRYFREGPGRQRARADQELAAAEGDRTDLLAELISLHIGTGRIGAAELVVLDWIRSARTVAKPRQLTAALKRHGDVLMAGGRFSKALARFDEVLLRQRDMGLDNTSVPGIRTQRSRAQALMGLGRWMDAYEVFRDLEVATKGNRAARNVLRSGNDRALVRAMVNRLVEAERIIDGALANNRGNFGADHPHTLLTEGLRALVMARFGRDELAMPQFRRYVEGWGYSLASADPAIEESALAQLRHRAILENYLAVLARRIDKEAAALGEAFRIADALRAGHVQQAVAAAAVRATVGDPALALLLREDQDLGHAAAALYRALDDDGGDGQSVANTGDIGARLRKIEARRAVMQADLRRRFPDYAQLVRPLPPLPDEIARHLAPHEVLLSIASTDEASYVFAVAADGRTQLHVAPLGERQLAELVRRMRVALDVGDTPLERLPPFDVAAAHEIYRALLLPLEPLWGNARHLIVSTGGSLGQIPFALLAERPDMPPAATPLFAEYERVPWLARRLAVSHVPSVAALLALRRLPPASNGRQPFVGFGDPDFGGGGAVLPGTLRSVRRGADAAVEMGISLREALRALAPLPDTRAEILALARTLGAPASGATYLGAAASRANALSPVLDGKVVVAFATHGLQPGELPGLDQPALAMASAGEGSEGNALLTLADVLGLKLNADWVILSACNTAGADGEAAEALSGLGRGFFFAGTRAILVTHWPVESDSARRLVSSTFARYAADPKILRAEALRAAQLELMKGRGIGYSLAHPLFWAPYALIGDGGR